MRGKKKKKLKRARGTRELWGILRPNPSATQVAKGCGSEVIWALRLEHESILSSAWPSLGYTSSWMDLGGGPE